MSRVSGFILIWTLIFQVALGTQLAALGFAEDPKKPNEGADSPSLLDEAAHVPIPEDLQKLEQGNVQLVEAIESGKELPLPPPLKGGSLFWGGEEVHRVYVTTKLENGEYQDSVAREIPIGPLNVLNPEVSIANPEAEIQVAYDAKRRELSFVRSLPQVYKVKSGGRTIKKVRQQVTDAHVIRDIDVTSIESKSDGNWILLGTARGVVGFSRQVLFNGPLFQAKLPLSTLVPMPAGHVVSKIEVVLPGVLAPTVIDDQPVMEAGQLLLTVKENFREYQTLVPFHEWFAHSARGMLAQFVAIQIANPDLSRLNVFGGILAQNKADLNDYYELTRELFKDGPDFAQQALINLGYRLNGQLLPDVLSKGANGQNAFQNILSSPRHVFANDLTEDAEWVKDHRHWLEGKQFDLTQKQPPRSVHEILAAQRLGKEQEYRDQVLEKLRHAEQNMLLRMSVRMGKALKEAATPKRLWATAVIGAGLALNSNSSDRMRGWALANVTQLIESTSRYAAQVPALGESLQQPFIDLAHGLAQLQDPSIFMRAGSVIGFMWLVPKISDYMARLATGDIQSPEYEKFFEWGLKAYRIGNTTIFHKMLWTHLLGQKNLYDGIVLKGLDPFTYVKAWLNVPDWATVPFLNKKERQARLDEQLKKVDAIREDKAATARRAAVLAATIVSETEAAKGQPIDIASLIMAAEGKPLETYLRMAQDPVAVARWSELTILAQKELVHLSDKGLGDLSRANKSLVEQYYRLYKKVAWRFEKMRKAESSRTAAASLAIGKVTRDFFGWSKQILSQRVLQYALFNPQAARLNQMLKSVRLDPVIRQSSIDGYAKDFQVSQTIAGIQLADRFAQLSPTSLGPFAPQVGMDAIGQVAIYSCISVVQNLKAAGRKMGLVESYRPLSDLVDEKENSVQRKQTFGNAAQLIGRKLLDPDAQSLLGRHVNNLEVLQDGFQVNYAVDAATRYVGMGLTRWAKDEAIDPVHLAGNVAQFSAAFLTMKVGFSPSRIGYATVWPYVYGMGQYLGDEMAANKKALQNAHAYLESGIRLNDPERYRKGAALMLELYTFGKTEIPAEYLVPAVEYTRELAAGLRGYAKGNIPVETEASPGMNWVLYGGIGAGGSTLLYGSVSNYIYSGKADASQLLMEAGKSYGETYAALKVAEKVAGAGLRAGHKIYKRFKKKKEGGSGSGDGGGSRDSNSPYCEMLILVGGDAGDGASD